MPIICLAGVSLAQRTAHATAKQCPAFPEHWQLSKAEFQRQAFDLGFEIWERKLGDGRKFRMFTIPFLGMSSFYDLRSDNGAFMSGEFSNFNFRRDAHGAILAFEVHYPDQQYNERLVIHVDLDAATVQLSSEEHGKSKTLSGPYLFATGIAEEIQRKEKIEPLPGQSKLQIQKLNGSEFIFRLTDSNASAKIVDHLTLPEGVAANLINGRFLVLGFSNAAAPRPGMIGAAFGGHKIIAAILDLKNFILRSRPGENVDVSYGTVYDSTYSIWTENGELSTGTSGSSVWAATIQDAVDAVIKGH